MPTQVESNNYYPDDENENEDLDNYENDLTEEAIEGSESNIVTEVSPFEVLGALEAGIAGQGKSSQNRSTNKVSVNKKSKKKTDTAANSTSQSCPTHKVEIHFTEEQYILLKIMERYCDAKSLESFIKKITLAYLSRIDNEIHKLEAVKQVREFLHVND